jgi:Fibronectin type III domain
MAVLTEEDFPGPPQNIFATAVDNSTIRVQWLQPASPNGKITMYRLMILSVGPHHPLPVGCERPPAFNDTDISDDQGREYIFKNGLPHFEYQFQVSATNGAGIGKYTQPVSAVTLPSSK